MSKPKYELIQQNFDFLNPDFVHKFMLQKTDPIDVLFARPDNELKTAVKKGDFPLWVVDYVEYVIAGDGNEEGDYFTTGEGDYGSRSLSYPSNRRSGGKGSSRQTYH